MIYFEKFKCNEQELLRLISVSRQHVLEHSALLWCLFNLPCWCICINIALMTHLSLLEVKLKYLFSVLAVRIHQNCTWKSILLYEFLNMAEVSSGLDRDLEASGKINSVMVYIHFWSKQKLERIGRETNLKEGNAKKIIKEGNGSWICWISDVGGFISKTDYIQGLCLE